MKRLNRVFYPSLVIIMLAVLSSACSQAGLAVINLWAKAGSFEVDPSIAYGEHRLQTLDVYRPSALANSKDAQAPVLVFFYGGCWGGCNTYEKAHYRFVADTFTAAGYVVVIADYRRYPDVLIEPILQDAAAATRWVTEHIADYNGNPDQIYLAGHSAGAHLAVMTLLDQSRLTSAQREQIAGFIGLAGPYDFLPFTEPYQEKLFAPEANYPSTQPINWVTGTEPPMLLLWGDADSSVYEKNIVNMAAKIEQLGGQVQTHIYPAMDHVEILTRLARPFKNKASVVDDIRAFIANTPESVR